MPRNEIGAVLLEAMIALAIVAAAGASTVAVLRDTMHSGQRVADRESSFLAAHRILTASTLLTRDELDQRLGRRAIGEFLISVQRPEPRLYRLAVADSAAPELEMLVTVVYRAAQSGGAE